MDTKEKLLAYLNRINEAREHDGVGRPQRFDPERTPEALDRHRVDYVMVGEFASRLHGARRPTYDIDFVLSTTAENDDRLASWTTDAGPLDVLRELPATGGRSTSYLNIRLDRPCECLTAGMAWLRSLPATIDATEIEEIYATARLSRTWK